jgi:polyisoprenoid-binding protein YceI
MIMKQILSFILLFTVLGQPLMAQKYFTRSGQVSFHSRALMEDIDAYNNQGTFVMDLESKQVQMAVLIKAFQFEKALMQEHFNENYMESDRYPKAEFNGQLADEFQLKTNEIHSTKIEGTLTIRGISKNISTTATFKVDQDKIYGESTFPIKVSDFNISIPGIVRDKIAKEVEVKIKVELEAL